MCNFHYNLPLIHFYSFYFLATYLQAKVLELLLLRHDFDDFYNFSFEQRWEVLRIREFCLHSASKELFS